MRIISQDGMIDIPYENLCFSMDYRDSTRVIVWDIGSNNGDVVTIAKYSTQEKAMKAMEMLRSAYTEMPVVFENVDVPDDVADVFKRTKINGIVAITDDKEPKIEYVNNVVFQFPKDEEGGI